MSASKWYILEKSEETGPFDENQITQLIDDNMISQDSYLIKEGWKEWVQLEESKDILMNAGLLKNTRKSPRASVKARVIIHGDGIGKIIIAIGVNISATGLFIEAKDTQLKIGDQVKITCKIEGYYSVFNTIAKVVRYNGNEKFPVGYGLHFIKINPKDQEKISEIVAMVNSW